MQLHPSGSRVSLGFHRSLLRWLLTGARGGQQRMPGRSDQSIASSSPRHPRPENSPEAFTIALGAGAFDPVHRVLISRERKVSLSPRESDVLFQIVASASVPCSLEAIARETWGRADAAESSACRQVVLGLRAKLNEFGAGVSLLTIHGLGYVLSPIRRSVDLPETD